MTVLIACGLQTAWCDFAGDRLTEMGVQSPVAATRVEMDVETLTSKICSQHDLNADNAPKDSLQQIEPGKAWHIAAADIFIANSNSSIWGWADPRNIHLLDFWRNFDPHTKFVLIYGSPEECFAQGLLEGELHPDNAADYHEKWLGYHTALLAFYQHNIERAALIHISALENGARDTLQTLSDRFELNLKQLDIDLELERSKMLELLSERFLETDTRSTTLLSEIHSAADTMPIRLDIDDQLGEKAFAEYQQNSDARASYEAASKELEAARNDLQTARTDAQEKKKQNATQYASVLKERAKLLEELEAARYDLRTARTDAQEKKKQNATQYASVLQERAKLLEERAEAFKEHTSVAQELVATKEALAELKAKVDRQDRRPPIAVNEDLQSLKQENALLLRQMHQVQEELELYFGKYQDLKQSQFKPKTSSAIIVAPPSPKAEPKPQPRQDSASIDLRSYLNGTGWHAPEENGRWAGLSLESTIRVPGLKKSRYRLTMDIIDAMSIDIARNLKLQIDDHPLDFKIKILSTTGGRLAPLRRLKAKLQRIEKPYPLQVSAKIPASVISETKSSHELKIMSSDVISPASIGEHDTRNLSVCVSNISVSKTD